MMKTDCGMISLTFNVEDYLLVIGGFGPYPCPQQHGAGYIIINDTHAYTNESHYYQLTSGMINMLYYQCCIYQVKFITVSILGRWVAPNIIGRRPPSYKSCVPLPNNRALVIGGQFFFSVHLAQCMETEVVGTI